MHTKEDVLRLVEEEDVEFIRLQFTDLTGQLKNIAVTAARLEHILDTGCVFDAASIDPMMEDRETGRLLEPDFDTFEIFPWRPQQARVARLLCDVRMPDGAFCEGDSRSQLRKAIDRAKQSGYTLRVGPECEFFLFDTDQNAEPTTETGEQAGYFDLGPLDGGENARRDIVMNLEDMGILVDSSHHESAPAQHELDLAHEEALRTADNIQTFKLAARTIGKRHGLHATFMPKPKFGVNGSGMHLNLSLHDADGKNVFEDPSDPNGISETAYFFIGGILKHMRAMAAVTNPLVNSYKRLVPGYEAPVYIAWSGSYRNQLLRVPVSGHGASRVELRSPDSAANPYLTLALLLHAGLDGIENRIRPEAPVDEDISRMPEDERKARGIERLPETLIEAASGVQTHRCLRSLPIPWAQPAGSLPFRAAGSPAFV